jgi:hypothetical protein
MDSGNVGNTLSYMIDQLPRRRHKHNERGNDEMSKKHEILIKVAMDFNNVMKTWPPIGLPDKSDDESPPPIDYTTDSAAIIAQKEEAWAAVLEEAAEAIKQMSPDELIAIIKEEATEVRANDSLSDLSWKALEKMGVANKARAERAAAAEKINTAKTKKTKTKPEPKGDDDEVTEEATVVAKPKKKAAKKAAPKPKKKVEKAKPPTTGCIGKRGKKASAAAKPEKPAPKKAKRQSRTSLLCDAISCMNVGSKKKPADIVASVNAKYGSDSSQTPYLLTAMITALVAFGVIERDGSGIKRVK